MCKEPKIEGNYTNNSLCATGATSLFDAGIPEALIQKRTGHRTLEALRSYERVTPSQNYEISKLLEPQTNDDLKLLDDLFLQDFEDFSD